MVRQENPVARQVSIQCHKPFLVKIWMSIPGGKRERDLGHTVFQLGLLHGRFCCSLQGRLSGVQRAAGCKDGGWGTACWVGLIGLGL